MYICICNAVTDRQIRQAADDGVDSMAELSRRTGCSDCCGSCTDLASEILEDAVRRLPFPLAAAA
ncbi:MAG: (2Fe-2S)-binding protein [Dokdonella sp.]